MTLDEREALEDLLDHPGWKLVTAHAMEVYDTHFLDTMESLLNNATLPAEQTRELARQAAAVRVAVRGLLEWPRRQVEARAAHAAQ